jgi:hypothetical protein
MQNMERRSFLSAAIAALPLALMGQPIQTSTTSKPARVARGEDRLGEHHTIGVSTTAFKVLTQNTGGCLFVMEHTSSKKGARLAICTTTRMNGSTSSKVNTSPKSAPSVSS